MADLKLSQLSVQNTPDPENSYVLGVDVSDTSQAPTGSNYRFKLQDLVDSVGGTTPSNFVWVKEPSDFGTSVGGVITLAANTTYYITTTVDLNGDRLVGNENTTLLGATSEISRLTSTGLGATEYLYTTQWTCPVRYMTFQDVTRAVHIDGSLRTVAADWDGVNFLNVSEIGLINDVDNFIYDKGAFLNSTGISFDGTIGTVGLNNSIFVGTGAAVNIFNLESTLVITRRFRITYSSLVAFGATVGINIVSGATLPSEAFILDTVNFSGGSTYVNGLTFLDEESRWIESRGVENTTSVGGYSMAANAIETPVAVAGTAYKVEGTTTPYAINQRFTHTNNRLTYTGALTRFFQISASVSLRCPSRNNEQIGIYVAVNGVVVPESEVYTRTLASSDLVNANIIFVSELMTSDEVEIWVENEDSASNILVENLNCVVKALK